MLRSRASSVVFAFGLIAASAAWTKASFVTYTETGVGSGSFGGASFTNAAFTITGVADTTNVTGSGIFLVKTSNAVVSVAGFGLGTFTDVIQAVDNQADALAGFGDSTSNQFVVGTADLAFASFDLKSSIGPISNSARIDLPHV